MCVQINAPVEVGEVELGATSKCFLRSNNSISNDGKAHLWTGTGLAILALASTETGVGKSLKKSQQPRHRQMNIPPHLLTTTKICRQPPKTPVRIA